MSLKTNLLLLKRVKSCIDDLWIKKKIDYKNYKSKKE